MIDLSDLGKRQQVDFELSNAHDRDADTDVRVSRAWCNQAQFQSWGRDLLRLLVVSMVEAHMTHLLMRILVSRLSVRIY